MKWDQIFIFNFSKLLSPATVFCLEEQFKFSNFLNRFFISIFSLYNINLLSFYAWKVQCLKFDFLIYILKYLYLTGSWLCDFVWSISFSLIKFLSLADLYESNWIWFFELVCASYFEDLWMKLGRNFLKNLISCASTTDLQSYSPIYFRLRLIQI